MELETINRLYLELSQVATAKTERERKLELDLDEEKWEHGASLEVMAELRNNLESCGERANKLQSEKDRAMQDLAELRTKLEHLQETIWPGTPKPDGQEDSYEAIVRSMRATSAPTNGWEEKFDQRFGPDTLVGRYIADKNDRSSPAELDSVKDFIRECFDPEKPLSAK